MCRKVIRFYSTCWAFRLVHSVVWLYTISLVTIQMIPVDIVGREGMDLLARPTNIFIET